eukprot:862505-Prymnesium_polylepis.1
MPISRQEGKNVGRAKIPVFLMPGQECSTRVPGVGSSVRIVLLLFLFLFLRRLRAASACRVVGG